MNHLEPINRLHNRYVAMRHGMSAANAARLIVGDPSDGIGGYGLTESGAAEVEVAVRRAKASGLLGPEVLIYASDFKRTMETAEIARQLLCVPKVHATPALRERQFGSWEKTSSLNYARVWLNDVRNPANHAREVESALDVLDRTTAFIAELEQAYADQTILLVSHSDTLLILQAAFEGEKPVKHRWRQSLSLAEIWEFKFQPE